MELWRAVPKGVRETVRGERCPKCRSVRVHRSHSRTSSERLFIALTPVRPFACRACRWRGWRTPVGDEGPVQDLGPMPKEYRRRTPRTSKSASTVGRTRRQVALVVLLSMMSAGLVVVCHVG